MFSGLEYEGFRRSSVQVQGQELQQIGSYPLTPHADLSLDVQFEFQ